MTSAALFDFDGVVIESRPAITTCLNMALQENGFPSREQAELVPMIGPPLAAAFAQLTGLPRESDVVAGLVASYRHHYATVSLTDTDLIPGIDGVLRHLAARRTLALATSKSSAFVRPLLAHFGIEELFTVVCAPAMSTLHESKGETIRRALAELGLPRLAVMVGDRSHDIIGARENGIRSIGVTWGVGDLGELNDAGADAIVHDFDGLRDAIDDALRG